MQSRSGYKNAKKGQKKTPTEPFYGFCWVPIGDLAGNRTRDCAVRGRRLNRLTTRPISILFRFPLAGNTSRVALVPPLEHIGTCGRGEPGIAP